MAITLNAQPGQRIIELGCGENPHPSCQVHVDVRAVPGIDFQVDLGVFPWPIGDNDFDGVFSQFVLEHLPYSKTVTFLSEVLRILKPGGKAIIVTPNTERQMQWILSHREGWDDKKLFESASELLYGSQSYDENYHKAFFSPAVAVELFNKVGFEGVLVSAYGERDTDMAVEATKPKAVEVIRTDGGHPYGSGGTYVQKTNVGSKEPQTVICICGAVGPNGAVCNQIKGHTGKHKASVVKGVV